MSDTYTNLLYHLVFSTKHRLPLIDTPDFQSRLYQYLGGSIRGLGGTAMAIGGMPDHVHLLVNLRTQPDVSAVLRQIKSGSSKWVHETFPKRKDFRWQTGYGAFSVSYSQRHAVINYINTQQERHAKGTFQSEFRIMLRKHDIEFDEATIWL